MTLVSTAPPWTRLIQWDWRWAGVGIVWVLAGIASMAAFWIPASMVFAVIPWALVVLIPASRQDDDDVSVYTAVPLV